MDEFTPITTQEQLDAVIGERLKRERETVARKYGDYETLKTQAADWQRQLAELGQRLAAAGEKNTAQAADIARLNDRIRGYETSSAKMRIAHETGIPYELADRLCGETEDDIRRDAAGLAKLLAGPTTAAPLCSTEPAAPDSRQAALSALRDRLLGDNA